MRKVQIKSKRTKYFVRLHLTKELRRYRAFGAVVTGQNKTRPRLTLKQDLIICTHFRAFPTPGSFESAISTDVEGTIRSPYLHSFPTNTQGNYGGSFADHGSPFAAPKPAVFRVVRCSSASFFQRDSRSPRTQPDDCRSIVWQKMEGGRNRGASYGKGAPGPVVFFSSGEIFQKRVLSYS